VASERPAPIVLVSTSLVLGAVLGGGSPAPWPAIGLAVFAASAAIALKSRRGAAIACLAVAAGAAGAALQGGAWRAAERRLDAAFHGVPVLEIDLSAVVVESPERDRDGGRNLLILVDDARAPGLRVRAAIAEVPPDDAPRLDALRRGDRILAWCRLRAPSAGPGLRRDEALRRLLAQRLDATGRIKSSRLVRLVTAGRTQPGRAIDVARAAARMTLDTALGTTGAARSVIGAMVVGDRLLIDEETNGLLRDAGLIHILSISGLHTSLTVLLLLAVLRRSGLGARGVLVAGVASLVVFSAFVGQGASVWRACAGTAVGLAGRAASRDVEPLSTLALASAALIVAVPPLAWSLSFALSVIATAGLVLSQPTRGAARDRSLLARSLAASTGAYLASAPLIAVSFARLAPVALAANLLAAPLCAACLGAGAATLALSTIPIAGGLAAWAARGSVEGLLAVSRMASAVPGGHFRVAPPSLLLAVTYVAALVVARFTGRLRLAFVLIAIALHIGPYPPGPGPFEITVLDVGQGLAVLARGPDGGVLVADAGPSGNGRFDAGDRIVVPALVSRGTRRVGVLLLSHDHDDHAGGAAAVLRDLEVGELWVGEGTERDPKTRALVADAVARGIAVRRMTRGDTAFASGLAVDVLHPGRGDRGRPLNDRCLAVRLAAPDAASVLLPGDVEAGAERVLVGAGLPLRSDILVAPHHGAAGSSTRAFLESVAPRIVVVSAGAGNRFGHPSPAALARYDEIGAGVFRTDRDGSIVLKEAGARWSVSVERDRDRDEGEDEDQEQDAGEDEAPRAERLALVGEARVAVPEHEQNEQPERVRGWAGQHEGLDDHESRDGGDRRPGEPAVRPGRAGEDGVATVELPDGEEIHRRDEHADPGGAVNRADLDLRVAVEPSLENPRRERRTEADPVDLLSGRNDGRGRDADDEEWESDDESGNRPCGGDVEERLPRGDHTADPNHRAERSDEHRRARNEERKGRRDAVPATGDVVPHLMSAEDEEEERGVGDPVRQARKVEKLCPRGGRVVLSFPHPASRHGRGEKRREEEPRVEPDPPAWGGRERLGHGRGSIRPMGRTPCGLRSGRPA
jgi:competence protein ComEC